MDKEIVFKIQNQHETLVAAEQEIERLQKTDPGYPEGKEYIRPLERYASLTANIRSFLTIMELGGEGGISPAVVVEGKFEEKPRKFSLIFEVCGDELGERIYADWQDLLGTGFVHREMLPSYLMDSNSPNYDETIATAIVNQFELTLEEYIAAASALTPEEAQSRGFPAFFIDGLRAKSAIRAATTE